MGAPGGAQLQRDQAGRLQARLAVAPGQREQAQAGAVAVFGMLALFEQSRDGAPGRHADARAPVDQPLGRPRQVRPVGR